MSEPSLNQRLSGLAEPARRRALEQLVLERLAALLQVEPAQLDLHTSFGDLSTDSLKAVEFKQNLERELGLKLRSTLLFDCPTPSALCDHLLPKLSARPAASPSGARKDTSERAATATEPAAIIGCACRLPGSCSTPQAFWQLLHEGRDAIVALDDAQLGPRSALRDGLQGVPAFAGLIDDPAGFDARLFGMSPKEALNTDPQQRLVLQVVWEALENAGINPRATAPRKIAVFVGARGSEYHDGRRSGGDPAYQGTGASASALAGRVAHCFGFTGAAVTVDTACSASLVALHYAATELVRGDCEATVVVGVNLLLASLGMRATHAAGMLSPDGRCKTFSSRADGYVRSEGCVALVLRRLDDARRRACRVWGVVRGSAVNHDGTTSGLTVPSSSAQVAVVQGALANAALDADAIDYVECHGTGTELGDPIELQALSEALGTAARLEPLRLGSVKSQIGHTEPAAGLASVLKVLLAMQHGELPRTLHCDAGLNPHVDFEALGLQPALVASTWPKRALTLSAGVSSFGFTGTNAHVVLSATSASASAAVGDEGWFLLTLSANTPSALERLTARWAEWLPQQSDADVDAACRLSNLTRQGLPYRRAWVAANAGELTRAIGSARTPVERSSARQPPTTLALSGDAAVFLHYAQTFGARWPGFDSALGKRLASFSQLVGRAVAPVAAGQTGATAAADLYALAVACALGDALLALGASVDEWAGSGIGAAAAHLLAGADVTRVLPVLALGGSLEHLDTPGVAPLAPSAGRRVIMIGTGMDSAPVQHCLGSSLEALQSMAVALYEAGLGVDFETLRDGKVTQVEPPNYPFETEPYWLAPESSAASSPVQLPALSELRSPGLLPGARAFCIDLSLERSPWLRDHAVEGMPILPAAGVLSLLQMLGEQLLKQPGVAIRQLLLERAITLGEHDSVLHFVAFPDPGGDGFSVEVSTAPARSESFVRHAQALLGPSATAAGSPAFEPAAQTPGASPESLYALLRQAGVTHGASFQAISRLDYGSGRVGVDVAVPVAVELAQGVVGLDACFIASAGLLAERGDATARLPVGCDEMEFFRAPARELSARVSLQIAADDAAEVRVDLDIYTREREPVAKVRGLRLGARARRAPRSAAAFSLDWVEQALPLATRPDAQAAFDILSDDATFAERLCSVLRHVHRVEASARTLSEMASGGVPAAHHDAPLRHVVWINRRLSGPEFLRLALPELRQRLEQGGKQPFWCVTRGAHVGEHAASCDALSRSVLWGLSRTLQHEHPALGCTLVDFDPELSAEAECELLASEFRRNGSDPQVRHAGGVRRVARIGELAQLQPAAEGAVSLRRDASYLVTGGAGGLGRLAAEQLAQAGAGHVVVVSRTPRDVGDLQRRLEALGTELSVWELDVSDRDLLAGALERLAHSARPLRGVVHAAGVVQDRTLQQLTQTDLDAVLPAKVSGTWNLHQLTRDTELDFFVAYSSLAGVLGSPGQAGYAGANAFVDALMSSRNAQGLVGVSLAWGPWAETGMAARLAGTEARLSRGGLSALSSADGLSYFRAALGGARGAIAIADMNWATYAAQVEPRLLSMLPLGPEHGAGNTAAGVLGAELRELVHEQAAEARRRLQAYLRERVADVAGSRVISEQDSFFELGLDSLQAVAMRNRIERDLGIEVSPSIIFDYPTLADLERHLLVDHLGGQDSAAPEAPAELGLESFEPMWAHPESLHATTAAPSSRDLLAKLESSLSSLELELES